MVEALLAGLRAAGCGTSLALLVARNQGMDRGTLLKSWR